MRVLTVTNLTPDAGAPQRGRWVFDQIASLREAGFDVELFSFPAGRSHYLPAIARLRRLLSRRAFDLIHAHYGLSGWCARLAGARPLLVTFHGTDVRHPLVGALSRRLAGRVQMTAAVSHSLFRAEGGRAGLPRIEGASAVLPCGADLGRFGPLARAEARAALGLDPEGRYLFFAANPARPEKRHDRAVALARASDAELLAGGSIEPERMRLWLNAANAVLVTSEYEGFGMVGLEALACGVPVLSTPVGIAPHLLAGVQGCLVAPFELERWAGVARAHLAHSDPRVRGAGPVRAFSVERMAARVALAYVELAGRAGA